MKNYFNYSRSLTRFVIISIAITSIFSISIASFILNEVIEQHDEEMGDVSDKLRQAVTVSRVMANDTLLIQNLKNADRFSEAEETEIMRQYLNALRSHFDCSAAFLASEISQNYYTANGLQKKLDPKNDSHDLWYPEFLEKNLEYAFNIDTDEAKKFALTIFVDTRIHDENGNLLGVCGVGIGMDEMQKILEQNESQYGIEINLVDQNGLVQIDTDSMQIEHLKLTNIAMEKNPSEFVVHKTRGGYTVTRYIPDFDWYLVIQRNSVNSKGTFSNLISYMLIGFVILLAIFLSLIQLGLNRAHRKNSRKQLKNMGLRVMLRCMYQCI